MTISFNKGDGTRIHQNCYLQNFREVYERFVDLINCSFFMQN